jgi:hypothetical protein
MSFCKTAAEQHSWSRSSTSDRRTPATKIEHSPHSSHSRSEETFGPIKVTDTEVNPQSKSSSFNYRRYNTSTTTTRVSNTGTNFGRVHEPVLWHNKSWHWSTNRTRGYDPDLDGTTLPPIDDTYDPIQPPLIEPYDYRFPWGISLNCVPQCSFGSLVIFFSAFFITFHLIFNDFLGYHLFKNSTDEIQL